MRPRSHGIDKLAIDPVISCDCGLFRARLTSFPEDSPGRLVCYCRDCQSFLRKINRTDVLDSYGGTEVIPVYPSDIEILQGQDQLKCNRLTAQGTSRWTASCCNSPIANTRAGIPWVGLFHTTFTAADRDALEKIGRVRSRIHGSDALAGAPYRISSKIAFGDMLVVMPFLLKGKILRKHRNSPFFEADDRTPISEPEVLSG